MIADDDRSRAARGRRLRQVREALKMEQEDFAELLTSVAKQLGLGVSYKPLGISQRETGRREMDAEDYAVIERVDPAQRSSEWLAFGKDLKVGVAVGGKGRVGSGKAAAKDG